MLYFFIDESIGMWKINGWLLYLYVGISLLGTLAFYLLRSIGIYKLSKNANLKVAFMAFIPLVWIYPFILLVKEDRFFGIPYQKIAILLAVVFSIGEGLTIFYNVATYLPVVVNYFNGVDIYLMGGPEGAVEYFEDFLYVGKGFNSIYSNGFVLSKILDVVYYISGLFDLASSVIVVFAYFSVFRKYWPSHYVMAAILSLWIFPIMIFIIRNKKPVNYFEYVREKYGSYRNPYGGYYGSNQNNPYNNPSQPKNDNPFGEFENGGRQKVEDPFEEFNTDDKK